MKRRFSDPAERIGAYEAIMDRCAETLDETERAIENYLALQKELRALERYYTGPEWRRDFEADEAGLLPPGLKRGVLSEDGIADLLDRNGALREKIEKSVKQQNSKPK